MERIKRLIQLVLVPFYKIKFKLFRHSSIHVLCRLNHLTSLEGYNKIGRSVISSSRIGRGTYVGDNCLLSCTRIGRFCSLGSNIKVLSATHPTSEFVSTHPCFYSTLKQSGFSYVSENKFEESLFFNREEGIVAQIGNDVWIGDDVTILGGHFIGNGAVIATGSVVTKDVPPYCIVGGVPASVKKQRFNLEIIQRLESIKWWEKDMEWIASHSSHFTNVDDFLSNLEP